MNRNRNSKKSNQRQGRSDRKPSRESDSKYTETGDTRNSRVKRNTKSENDFEWYNRIPAITGDATKLQYSWPTGRPISIGTAARPYTWVAPGFQIEYLVPSYGFTSTGADPLNVSAQQLYAYLRKDQTSSAVFDQPDTMIYLFAIAETFSYIEFLRRVYGLASRANVENTYIPNSLLGSMGVSASDVIKHLGDFRYGINLLIQKVSQFAVPNVMTIFPRKVFLYSNIYTEGTSIKDQMYLYSPAGFYKYGNDPETKAGELQYVEFWNPATATTATLYTVDALLTYGRNLISALMNAGDVSFVSGAIVRTFGNNLITMNLLPEEYFITPTFDITVLEQMANATPIRYSEYNKPNLTQNPASNNLIFEPEITIDSGEAATSGQVASNRLQAMQYKKFIQTTTGEVTPAVTMENTRLMLITSPEDPMSTNTLQIFCATEICVGVGWVRAGYSSPATANWVPAVIWNFAQEVQIFPDNTANTGSQYYQYPQVMAQLATRSSFKFAPPVWIVTLFGTADGTTVTTSGRLDYMHDIGNFMVIENDELRRLHEAAMISMLDGKLYNVL